MEKFLAANGTTILIVIAFAVLLVFMFRNSRKRQREQAELQTKMVPGAEIMTSQGIFGRLISVDDDTNEAIIETTPGTRLRVHRQTLSRVVEPTADETADSIDEPLETPDGEPEFGERVESETAEPAADDAAPAADKPARAPRKKAGE